MPTDVAPKLVLAGKGAGQRVLQAVGDSQHLGHVCNPDDQAKWAKDLFPHGIVGQPIGSRRLIQMERSLSEIAHSTRILVKCRYMVSGVIFPMPTRAIFKANPF